MAFYEFGQNDSLYKLLDIRYGFDTNYNRIVQLQTQIAGNRLLIDI